jgi:salicylate hydroxylase
MSVSHTEQPRVEQAHAMLPHHGAGAGQAIEDAYILSGILASPTTTCATIGRALRAYDAVRRPRAELVLQRSREAGRMYESDEGMYGQDFRKRGEAIAASWGWLWEGGPEEDLERALALTVDGSSVI